MNRDEYEKGKGKGKEKEKNANNAAEAAEARRNNPIEMKVTENGEKKTVEMEKKAENEKKDSSAQKPKGLWPGERMFAADTRYWFIVFALWFLGLVLLSALLGKISALVIISYAIAFLAWLLLFCARTIPENMRAKPVLLGVIGKKVSWGTVEVLTPFEKLILFPTGVQQVNLTGKSKKDDENKDLKEKKTGAGILTKAGFEEIKLEDGAIVKIQVPSILLPVEPVLNFRWPSDDDDLTEAIKNAPSPDDLESLRDKIEELILDILRSVGGKRTYVWLLQNRDLLAAEVNEALRLTEAEANEFDSPKNNKVEIIAVSPKKALAQMIHLMRLRNMTVSFKHMDLHKDLLDAQIAEASSIHRGEAAKKILKLEGEGKAYAEAAVRTAILDVLTSEKYANVAMRLEGMKAFVDASQGGKGTIIFPTELLNALGGLLGSKSSSNVLGDLEKAGITQEKLAQLVAAVLAQKKE
ncbi:hypothetical protein KKB43_05240 [Patescibacteria group bacterium]|nr:hypothetical protein [Patescibacteria group bacterium]MBU4580390.1 hypothetical protein [Patescibacteria group bacterium]